MVRFVLDGTERRRREGVQRLAFSVQGGVLSSASRSRLHVVYCGMKSKTYRDLRVWQKSLDLTVEIYKLTSRLPDAEKYGLRSQMQRAASSIPMNIAEGHARQHRKEFLHHLSYAKGSLAELETQLILTSKLDMISRETLTPVWTQAQEVGKMLNIMIRKLKELQDKTS